MKAFKEIEEAIKTACQEWNVNFRGIAGGLFGIQHELPVLDITSTLDDINKAITRSDSNAEEQTTVSDAWAVFLCIWEEKCCKAAWFMERDY